MKTLYQYSIKTNGLETVLVDWMGKGKKSPPISCVYEDAESSPIIAATLLRDLAKWATEQAKIIEELEGKRIHNFC